MITVNLNGGIGNQMFQYAAAAALAKKLHCQLLLNIHEYKKNKEGRQFELHVFPNVTDQFISEGLHKLLNSSNIISIIKRALSGYQVYKQPHYHVDSGFFLLSAPVHLRGYFQSEKYFADHENLIRSRFKWDPEKLSKATNAYLTVIESMGDNAVSVHIRRGDYISNQEVNQRHGTCSTSYYQDALALINERVTKPHHFIFSDDLDWVKDKNIFGGVEHTYIEKTPDMHDSEEIHLMSQCQHNVSANSSFSWWGAWLNNNPEKIVIAPNSWFRAKDRDTKDLIPDSWIKI
jgi:hypothetical protein